MFGNIGKMMKLVGEMKTRLPEMQAKLAAARFTAEAGGGAVKAVVSGKGTLVELSIDPAALAGPQMTAETLADAIKEAVAAAQERASQAAQAAMHELTGGMEIPGMGGMM